MMLVPSPSMRELLKERLQVYEEQFRNTPEALTYWGDRGLTKEIAEAFHIGFVADPLKGDSRYYRRLAIPYITANDRPVSFKFRAIDNSKEKYTKDKGDPSRIFNSRVLTTATGVVITEGELDAVAAMQCGLDAVGIPGANQWKPEWTRIFRNRVVTVLADGDDAGMDFAELVNNYLYGVRTIEMPPGEDVCSMLKLKGHTWIREAVLGDEASN